MLNIQTFGAEGGNILYKALSHPLIVEKISRLAQSLKGKKVAFYDPENVLATLKGLYPAFKPTYILTHDTEKSGKEDGYNGVLRALIDFPYLEAECLFALSFDGQKMRQRVEPILAGRPLITLEEMKLPSEFTPVRRRYLDKLNFATNFAFFRDDDEFSTRLVTANYWSSYGAIKPKYWCLLFDKEGKTLAQWEEEPKAAEAGILIESEEVRRRFNLPAFMGQLFIHVIGAAGHDVVKYALDTYGKGENKSLSVTHDANAWPSMRFATLPAPAEGEEVLIWIQNSHGTPIPAGEILFNPMGIEEFLAVEEEIAPYATRAVSLNKLFPDYHWPAQFELRAGQHLVRPRYEILQHKRTRIAHLNVERGNLKPDDALKNLSPSLGRGFILPFPILDPQKFESFVQPNPMSEALESLPLRLDIFNEEGHKLSEYFLGNLPREHQTAIALHDLTSEVGHADLVYDFREGGEADGWLHALMRYHHRQSGHAAETSFGAHIFNTLMTWRSEPQSYSGPPPGLSTRLFLKLGHKIEGVMCHSFCYLIYPTSLEKGAPSQTELFLYNKEGRIIAQTEISLKASGSYMLRPSALFKADSLEEAGETGYIIIRDTTCRLFGYHGIARDDGSFSLDHMFGF